MIYRILIIEDEKAISDLISMHLTLAGYRCTCKSDGTEGADAIESMKFDLILLDIMLPGADGYELMDYIRPLGIPVIFITAKHDVKDRVKGLRLGADDYLIKPFDIVELQARVETVLKRYYKMENIVHIGDVTVNYDARVVTKAKKPVDLTVKEYKLLVLFIKNKNIALFRDVIYEKVWECEYDGDSRTIDLHVQRLRKKLGFESILKTVYKVGYRLEVG